MTIVPDDKDWTWVLERPCPDCGYDAREFANANMAHAFRDLVPRWQAVLVRPDVKARPTPTKWSPLEYSCHVRDVFRVTTDRVRLLLSEDDARFANWDQDKTALESRYDLQDPATVSTELAEAGTELAREFAAVTGEQWQRRGLRSNGSEFTLGTLALYVLHDPVHHLWDVSGS
jgi:DinB superfamily